MVRLMDINKVIVPQHRYALDKEMAPPRDRPSSHGENSDSLRPKFLTAKRDRRRNAQHRFAGSSPPSDSRVEPLGEPAV